MKYKHNKKRNTAFLYEALIDNLTKASLEKNEPRIAVLLEVLKKHFKPGSVLRRELDAYKSVYKTTGVSRSDAKSIISETKRVYGFFDDKQIFNAQTKLVDDVNKKVGAKLFDTYLSNYKDLASLSQIFSKNTPPKTRVLLEKSLVKGMIAVPATEQAEEYDPLVLKTFSKAYNKEYKNLTEGQKHLVTLYINSLGDDGLELKNKLSEEIGVLKDFFTEKKKGTDIEINQRLEALIEMLDSYKGQYISERILLEVLKMQDIKEDLLKDD